MSSIADKFKELVAYKFLRSFQVKGFEKGPRGEDYNDFIDSIYEASRSDRAESIFSEDMINTPPKTRIVVEIPVFTQSRGRDKAKMNERGGEIIWRDISKNSTGRQISVAGPSEDLNTETHQDRIQDLVDRQLTSDGVEYGIDVDGTSASVTDQDTPPNVFVQQLQAVAERTTPPLPPPLPPKSYSPSLIDRASNKAVSSRPVILDLCEDSDVDEEELKDEIRELSTFDLTNDVGDVNDPDEEDRKDDIRELPSFDVTSKAGTTNDPDDFQIIATARFSLAGHSIMAIRSRSRSSAAVLQETPTHRPPKRTRGGAIKKQTR